MSSSELPAAAAVRMPDELRHAAAGSDGKQSTKDVCIAERERWFVREIVPLRPWLRKYLIRHWPRLDADEMLQECMVRILQVADLANVSKPRGYLIQVARSLGTDHFRRAAREAEALKVLQLESDFESRSPERIVAGCRRLERAYEALDGMPESWRRSFLLRRWQCLSLRDAAEVLGISVSAVEKNSRAALRRIVQAAGDGA